MSKYGLASLLIAGLSLVIVIIARFILGGWLPMLWAPLGLGLASLALMIFLESRVILEFLTMRTTKNGMNMGVIILMALILLISVNYLSVRFDQTVDLTEEGINSLSPQSEKVLNQLDKEVVVRVFYKGETAATEREQLRSTLKLYKQSSADFRTQFYNTDIENMMAQKYLNSLPDKDAQSVFAFVEYGEKRIRIDSPLAMEEKVTSAIVKATRSETKTIYFVKGHGERDLEGSELTGLQSLKQALIDSSFQVKSLDLTASQGVPKDADVVAILGPRTPLLKAEIDLLLSFAESGGRLMIAADPGERHNIALLTKPLGVEYKNNFILSPISRFLGKSAATAIGNEYSLASEITKNFRSNMTVFDLASELSEVEGSEIETIALVKTHEQSFTVNDLQNVTPGKQQSFPVAMSAEGTYAKASEPKSEAEQDSGQDPAAAFAAVVFGDTDFFTNKGMILGLNRDLVLNSFSFLADETDIISIRPKQLKGTQLSMGYGTSRGIVIAGISLPLLLFMFGGFLWYRRRGI